MSLFPHPRAASVQQIIQEAHQLFLAYVEEFGEEYILRNGIKFNDVYDAVIYPKYEIQLDVTQHIPNNDNDEIVLGRYDPIKNIAYINKKLIEENDPRLTFTIYHEVAGHGIFHGEYLRKTLRKHPTLNTTENSIIDETMNTFEWQANAFAANLAAPIPFINVLSVLNYGMNRPFIYNGPSEYCLTYNNQTEWIFIRTKNDLARAIARKIQHFFDGLSIETLSYQIEKGLIHEPFRSYNQLITIPETSIIGDLMMDIYS